MGAKQRTQQRMQRQTNPLMGSRPFGKREEPHQKTHLQVLPTRNRLPANHRDKPESTAVRVQRRRERPPQRTSPVLRRGRRPRRSRHTPQKHHRPRRGRNHVHHRQRPGNRKPPDERRQHHSLVHQRRHILG